MIVAHPSNVSNGLGKMCECVDVDDTRRRHGGNVESRQTRKS